jgi:Transposase DDE domain group 1
MVQREGLVDKLVVTADGTGQVGHAGSALLVGTADRIGLTRALSQAMAPTRERRSAHDPGVVLRDLAVMLADGGDCLADMGALRDQPDLFGQVASDSTAFRVVDSIDEQGLERLREAVAVARSRAWKLGARPQRRGERAGPERTVIDIDATLTTAYSEKEGAHGNFKGGYGYHPLLCYLDDSGEAPAGILRPGNAGSNTAVDHTAVLDLALAQLDQEALDGEILVRGDGAGATHELTVYCREGQMRFSFGFDLTEPVREAIVGMPESTWVKAIRADGSERKHSWVCEITDHVDLSAWPEGSRLIARRTKLHDGDQQSFEDHDGYRLAVFLTDQEGDDVPRLDLDHRGHARVEDHIREGKDCGLQNLPFRSFAHNQVWLFLVMLAQDLVAWTKQLCLAEQTRAWELKRLRYRLLHQSGRIARHARRRMLRLARDWPWAGELAAAFARLQALPALTG